MLCDEYSHLCLDISLRKRSSKGKDKANDVPNAPDLTKPGVVLIIVQQPAQQKKKHIDKYKKGQRKKKGDFYKPCACRAQKKSANSARKTAASNRRALHRHA